MHIHGINGFDVMDGSYEEIGKQLRQIGIEWFCPTTVAAPLQKINQLLNNFQPQKNGAVGFHLEGPYLNPKYKGAQPEKSFIKPNTDEFLSTLSNNLNKISLVTLAPELEDSMSLIKSLNQKNIIINAGHTDATHETMQTAVQHGLSGITHFFNAMRPFHHRETGCIGFGLLNNINCEIIYDRIHVHKNALDLLLKTKSIINIIAISDGTKLSGTQEGTQMEMWGQKAIKKDGASRLQNGTLSGSAVTLLDVFQNLWQDYPERKELAVYACSHNPRRILKLPPPQLWLLIDSNAKLLEIIEGRLSGTIE
jgi:N-acetylglucosamine-6-phosphate deacetylase